MANWRKNHFLDSGQFCPIESEESTRWHTFATMLKCRNVATLALLSMASFFSWRLPFAYFSVSVCVCVCGCVPSIVPFVCLVFVSVCFSYFSPMKFVRCWGRKTDNNEKHGVVMDETPLLWTLFDGCHLLREAAFIVVLHLMPFSPGWHIVDNGPPSSAS